MRISPPEIRVDHAKSHINENFHPESFDQNTYMRSDSGQPLLEQATNKYNHDDHTYGNIGQQINELPPRINPRSSSLGHTLSNKGRQKLQHGVDQTPTKNFPSHSPTNRTFPVTIRSPKSPTSNETLYLNDRHPSKKDEESERPPLPSPRSTTLEDKSFTNSIANDIEDRPPLPTPRTRSLDVTLSNELKSSRKANSGRVVRSGNSSPEQSSVRPPLPIPRSELLSTLSGKASEATTKALSDMNSSKRSFSEASTLDRQKAPSTLNARGRVPDFPNSKSAISSLDNDDVFYRNLAGEHSNSSDISNGDDFYHVLEPSDETDSGDIIQDPFYQVLETYEEPDFVERDMENIGESRTVRPHTKVAVDDNIYDEFDSPDENIRNESKGSPVSIDSGICSDNGPFDKYYQALDEVTQEPYATLSRHK